MRSKQTLWNRAWPETRLGRVRVQTFWPNTQLPPIGPLVSSLQCLNTKCGQSKRFGTGPGRRPDWAGYGSRLFGQTHSCHPLVSERKYGHIHGCQKSLAIQMPKLRKRAIHILSLLKKGGLYLAALKKGGIGAHIRTMSYIESSGSAHAKLQFRSVLSHVILERRPSPVRVSPYSH